MVHRPRTDVVFEMNGRWMASSSGAETPRALTGERLLVLDAGLALLVVVGRRLLRFGPVGVALLAVALLGVAVQWLLRRKEANWVPLGRQVGRAGADRRRLRGGGRPAWPGTPGAGTVGRLGGEPAHRRAGAGDGARPGRAVHGPDGVQPARCAAPRRSRDDTRPAAYASGIATAIGLVLAATSAVRRCGGWWWPWSPWCRTCCWGSTGGPRSSPPAGCGPRSRRRSPPTRPSSSSTPPDPTTRRTRCMMWLPHLKRTGRPFLIVTRNNEPAGRWPG